MAKSDQIWQIPTISNYRSGQGQNGIYTHVCYVLFMRIKYYSFIHWSYFYF